MYSQHYNQLLRGIKIFLNVLSVIIFILIFGELVMGAILLGSFLMFVILDFNVGRMVNVWMNVFAGYRRFINVVAHYIAGFITGLNEPE